MDGALWPMHRDVRAHLTSRARGRRGNAKQASASRRYIQLVRADALLGPAGWNTSHKRGTNSTDIASEESRLQLTVVRRIVSVVTVSSVATVSIGSSSAVGRSQRQYRATPCHQASRAANRVFRSSLGGLPRRLALRAAGPWRKPVRRIIATGARGHSKLAPCARLCVTRSVQRMR